MENEMLQPQIKKNDYFGIINGPSKFDLMQSLFDNGDSRRNVVFIVPEVDILRSKHSLGLEIFISLVQRFGNSGEDWNVEGYEKHTKKKVVGYFSTSSRKGPLQFKD
jgi:hypothetical protein